MSAADLEVDRQITKLIKKLVKVSFIKDMLQTKFLLENLEELVSHHGVSGKQLGTLISLVTFLHDKDGNNPANNKLSVNHKTFIISKLLLPRSKILSSPIVHIVGCFGVDESKKKSLKSFPDKRIQMALAKWLVCVSFFLKSRTILARLNGMLFNFLSLDFLSQWISQLLYLLTQISHVKPWKLQFLNSLIKRSLSSSPFLTALLIHYEALVPNNINDVDGYNNNNYLEADGDADFLNHFSNNAPVISSTKIFTYPDKTFLNKWKKIVEASSSELSYSWFKVAVYEYFGNLADFEERLSINKKRKSIGGSDDYLYNNFFKISQVVKVINHDNSINESCCFKEIIWNDINTASKFLKVFDFLHVPDQLNVIFKNDLFYQLLIVNILSDNGDTDGLEKLDSYIDLLLSNPTHNLSEVKLVLAGCETYSKINGFLLPSIVKLLNLEYPGCSQYAWIFFPFLTMPSEISQENDFTTELCLKYEEIFVSSDDIQWCVSFLNSVIGLLRKWQYNQDDEHYGWVYVSKIYERFLSHILFNMNKFKDSPRFIEFCYSSCEFIGFLEDMPVSNNTFKIVSPFLIYRLLLSQEPNLVNFACHHINFLKNYPLSQIVDELQENSDFDEQDYFKTSIEIRNSFVLDFCNLLWRDRLFNNSKSNTKGLLVPKDFIQKIQTAGDIHWFNLVSHNTAFAREVSTLIKGLMGENKKPQDIREPITPKVFDKLFKYQGASTPHFESFDDLRVQILERLEGLGYDQVAKLLWTSLKSLATRRHPTED